MIDCNVTENYFTEKARMCTTNSEECCNCPLSSENDGTTIACSDFERTYYNKAIAIVQAWSDAHPARTYLSVLLEAFPKTKIGEDGTPGFCPKELGLNDIQHCRGERCAECWAQVIEG